MSARPWYKRYPADFIAGTLQLSLDEKDAYSVVIDLLYDRGAPEDSLVDEAVGLWNAMCDEPSIADCQIPKVQIVTANRRAASRNRAFF